MQNVAYFLELTFSWYTFGSEWRNDGTAFTYSVTDSRRGHDLNPSDERQVHSKGFHLLGQIEKRLKRVAQLKINMKTMLSTYMQLNSN